MASILNQKEQKLVEDIKSYDATGEPATTKLETDQKVLARITDGIYRFPGSAIRELISNAYDADAENVTIDTDAPRFESMSIRDDGNGMSIETLVNLLNHIGGSAKRNHKGSKLHVTDIDDPSLSKNKKRKLIGKIGIGLFSVAQLTRDFEIVTKEAGREYYVRASIKLHNYSEEYINKIESAAGSERGASFETGSVEIWTEKTDNINAHGTDVLLKNIKKSAKDQLKSIDLWGQEKAQADKDFDTNQDDLLNSSSLDKPEFHIGYSEYCDGVEVYDKENHKMPSLPWDTDTESALKFKVLYEKVMLLTRRTTNPKLNTVLDNYLNMIWTLSLSIPLDYIENHPFAYSHRQLSNVFSISNKLKGQVSELQPELNKNFAEICKFKTPVDSVGFSVVIDGVKLYRPIKFTNLPKSEAVVKDPLLFLGSYVQKFEGLDATESGGEISFDAYILWTPKVIPKDHNGVLVRLHNSSGILFDETFMRYQVAEHTIKSQLVAEIFVSKGLDSALNIDRESFNISHPHYQVIMTWLHQAIRQVVNKYKSVRKGRLESKRDEIENVFKSELTKFTEKSMAKRGKNSDVSPLFYLVDDEKGYSNIKGESSLSNLPIEAVRFEKKRFSEIAGNSSSKKYKTVEAKTESLIKLLDSYGLLENISSSAQQNLIEDIIEVLSFGE